MEISLDRRVFYALAVILGIAALGIIYLIATAIMGAATTAKIADLVKQNVSLNSICSQKNAMQMYLQNPNSTHPYVVKLRKDIGIYNELAAESRKNGSSISDFLGCN
jgi:hypothetical protein